jgi:hypothetical protein
MAQNDVSVATKSVTMAQNDATETQIDDTVATKSITVTP